jgi:hypothetical protein
MAGSRGQRILPGHPSSPGKMRKECSDQGNLVKVSLGQGNAQGISQRSEAAPEEWRPVPVDGYGHAYEVSSLGRVRRILSALGTVAGKILTPSPSTRGYMVVCLSVGGRSMSQNVHKLVALAFLGEPPPGMEVDHENRDPADARLSNLRYLTHPQNILNTGPRRCRACGGSGHNRLTCPQRNAAPAAEVRS